MDIYTIVAQLTTLFLILGAGYALHKLKIMSNETTRLLSKLVLCLTMPCTILDSVISGVLATSGEALFFLLMTLPVFLLLFAIAIPMSRALRGEKSDSGLYAYMIALGNAGFMGFPVARSIFGDSSAFFVALYNFPFTFAAFSVGIYLISSGRGKPSLRVMINPSLIVALVALVIFLTGIKIPSVISGSIKLISGMTTPCAMLVIGSTLAELPFREMFHGWRLYVLSLLRLIVVPAVMWLVLRNLISNQLMLGVLVLLTGMPVATTATMLAAQYGGNERLASKGIFITTLFSIVTIPVIVFLLFT